MKERSKRTEIYVKAFNKWGEVAQMEMLQEEATELALAARKFIRVKDNEKFSQLCSEVADVEIMIEQFKFMFSNAQKEIDFQKDFKLNRLSERLNKNQFED